ncbi:MAG: acyl-CoA dehydrogenase, partial [Erythrobacter sp.]
GWQLMKQADAVAAGAAPTLSESKPVTVRFFLDRIVPEALGLKAGAIGGADLLYALPAEKLAS